MNREYVGFGYNPKESGNHFYIFIPEDRLEDVMIYERFHWDEGERQIVDKKDILKLKISRHKWSRLSADVTKEFNGRLKAEKKPAGRFQLGGTPLEKLMGKELMVLLWGIENNDPSGIPTAIRNWLGLQPEERWWLYTMTNASTGGINDRKGWRMALRYALCENPVADPNQMTLDQYIGGSI